MKILKQITLEDSDLYTHWRHKTTFKLFGLRIAVSNLNPDLDDQLPNSGPMYISLDRYM